MDSTNDAKTRCKGCKTRRDNSMFFKGEGLKVYKTCSNCRSRVVIKTPELVKKRKEYLKTYHKTYYSDEVIHAKQAQYYKEYNIENAERLKVYRREYYQKRREALKTQAEVAV